MLSQQSKYALRAVQYLSGLETDTFQRVDEIAAATDLPGPYLSKVLKQLVKRGLLQSRRGKNGGVALSRVQPRLTFMDVCRAVDDPIVASECVLYKRPCNLKTPCEFHQSWSTTKCGLIDFLERETV